MTNNNNPSKELSECQLLQIHRNLHATNHINDDVKFIYYVLKDNMCYVYRNKVDTFGLEGELVSHEDVKEWCRKNHLVSEWWMCKHALVSQEELFTFLTLRINKCWVHPKTGEIYKIHNVVFDIDNDKYITLQLSTRTSKHNAKEYHDLFHYSVVTNNNHLFSSYESAMARLAIAWRSYHSIIG